MSTDTAAAEPRARPTEHGDEAATLTQMLDYLRATAVIKAAGLSNEVARSRPVPASALTVAGLIKHLTGVERFWFSVDFAGLNVAWPWNDDDPHGGFRLEPDDTIAALIEDYRGECARSRAAIAGHRLDAAARGEGMDFNLRYALTHLIEETARHCGHLDLLRESIDGQRGE